MTAFSKLTKAQLIEHIAKQDAQLVAKGREIESLRLERAMAQPVGSANTPRSLPKFYKYGREVAPTQRQLDYHASRELGNEGAQR